MFIFLCIYATYDIFLYAIRFITVLIFNNTLVNVMQQIYQVDKVYLFRIMKFHTLINSPFELRWWKWYGELTAAKFAAAAAAVAWFITEYFPFIGIWYGWCSGFAWLLRQSPLEYELEAINIKKCKIKQIKNMWV